MESFMEVVRPGVDHKGWIGSVWKEGHLPGERNRSICLDVGQGKVPLGRVRILVVEKCFSENLTSEV